MLHVLCHLHAWNIRLMLYSPLSSFNVVLCENFTWLSLTFSAVVAAYSVLDSFGMCVCACLLERVSERCFRKVLFPFFFITFQCRNNNNNNERVNFVKEFQSQHKIYFHSLLLLTDLCGDDMNAIWETVSELFFGYAFAALLSIGLVWLWWLLLKFF